MPKKPKRHYNPKRAIHNRKADPKRAKRRIESKILFVKQIMKERAIGVDPIFLHGNYDQRMAMRPIWKKISEEYERSNK